MNAMVRFARKLLPRPTYKALVRYYRYGFSDLAARFGGKRPPLTPPGHLIYTGGVPEEFHSIGNQFLDYFREYGSLSPSDSVLDIGSGIGRMAVPMTSFLDGAKGGRYSGFDIDKTGVKWCEENISARFPNFEFKYVDIYNKEYNASGKIKSRDFVFPYADDSFDFIFATSVFTHMYPDDIDRYISEIGRTLRHGGRCFLTFFLINEESSKLMEQGRNTIKFPYKKSDFYTKDKDVPEDAIAVFEDRIAACLAENGMEVKRPIQYGSWSGREHFLSFQDILITHPKR